MSWGIHTHTRTKQGGFSLLELMVTIAVLGIIVSIAVPSFRQMLRSSRLTSTSNELNALMQTARMEAVRSNGRVEICPTTDGATCGGGDWHRVVMIARKNGVDEVLREASFNAEVEIHPSASISSQNKIWYQADGFMRTGAAASPSRAGTLAACISGLSGENIRNISMNMGRVSVTRAGNGGACGTPSD